jgi:hypothetical protein
MRAQALTVGVAAVVDVDGVSMSATASTGGGGGMRHAIACASTTGSIVWADRLSAVSGDGLS